MSGKGGLCEGEGEKNAQQRGVETAESPAGKLELRRHATGPAHQKDGVGPGTRAPLGLEGGFLMILVWAFDY